MNSCRGVGLPRQSRGELEVPGRPARPGSQDTSIRLLRIVQSNAAHHGLDVLALRLGRRSGLARGDVPFKFEVVLRRVAGRAADGARSSRPGASPRVDPPKRLEVRESRAALRARETPEKLAQDAFRTAREKLAQERSELAQTLADASAKPSQDT